ncbi:lipopolysaccharide biosynthesis protein [Microbacterium sp. CFBP9034]|uniref:lipopolysaccharide biosynthesis protein n=1 Tax=Microbacterium sp. CFBP9034 TaxID=3096540 RepID=UPI002A6AC896|nr:lipopolysaccharide biosynthesis protein [Microbacterium sp. CFBP9034]MDY0907918.1 lipopolysaccharide biosynthesis protein [Microbacterium sp. CFBP9034]
MGAERLARSGLISLTGSAFAAVAALVVTSIVGNLLGASGTGLFFQAVGIFTILTQVLRLGTNSGVVRFISAERAFDRTGAEWRIVLYAVVPVAAVSACASIVLWLGAPGLARWLAGPGEASSLEELLQAMSPYVAVGAVIGVLQIAARMLRGVGAFTLLQSVLLPASRLLTVLIGTVVALSASAAFQAWLWPLPFWLLVSILVITAPFVRDFRLRHRFRDDRRATFRSFWRFNLPRALGASLESVLEWADVLIVAALASPEVAGVYAVATRTVRVGGIVDKAMRVAVAPRTSSLLARGELTESSRLHVRVVRAMILLNWPFYFLLISMGGSVLLVFGPEFVQGWAPMALMAAATMLQTAAGMLQSILLQGGRSTWQMYNKSLAVTISIAGNLLLVPLLGIWGAAITWVVVVVVDNALAAHQVHRRMGVHLAPRALIVPALLPLVVFGIGGAAFSWWGGVGFASLIVGTATLSAVYAVVLWALRRRIGIAGLWRHVPFIGRFA